ncbi:hypothetical protein ACPC54_40115 [Kitasatospora sp. NPDC094028]
MTGNADRIAELFRIKTNRLLDQAEDPREVLDFAQTGQVELLQQVRRSDLAARWFTDRLAPGPNRSR